MSASLLAQKLDHQGSLSRAFLLFTQSLFRQTAMLTVCNRYHSIEQRLCRWLLQLLDRLSSSELKVTQEYMASVLGVRRVGVTEAAGRLRREHLLRYCHGSIAVLDRQRLEQRCCECYFVLKDECRRLSSKSQVAAPPKIADLTAG